MYNLHTQPGQVSLGISENNIFSEKFSGDLCHCDRGHFSIVFDRFIVSAEVLLCRAPNPHESIVMGSLSHLLDDVNSRLDQCQINLDRNKASIQSVTRSGSKCVNELEYFTQNLLSKIKYDLSKVGNELTTFNDLETSLLYSSIAEMTEQETFGLEMTERMRIITRDMQELAVDVLGEEIEDAVAVAADEQYHNKK